MSDYSADESIIDNVLFFYEHQHYEICQYHL